MKTIFWNVDTQYDFMRSEGKLYVRGAEQIEGNLAKLTGLARKKGIKVVNTADWHNKNTEEIADKPNFIQTFPEHCMQNTLGAKFVLATNPENPYEIDWGKDRLDEGEILQRRNLILYKDKFDVFRGTPYAEKVLELIKPERAVVYGVATNVCVDCAVRGLLERRVQVYVPVDAIKELPNLPLPYENWQRCGAVLTTTNEIYKMLGERK